MTDEQKQDFTIKISQANSTELIVILYEMLLIYVEDAAREITNENATFHESIRKARGCVNELMASTHTEYEIGKQLMQLYIFCIKRLANADVRKNKDALSDIKRIITPLKEAYEQVAMFNTNGPVMNNTQELYAGLTYGKNILNINISDLGYNRGMLA